VYTTNQEVLMGNVNLKYFFFFWGFTLW
jgi:hypothetical protein